MTAKIIDGEAIAAEIKKTVAADAAELAAAGKTPRLVAVLAGDNPGAKMYAGMQAKACESVGIEYELITLPSETTEDELIAKISELNADEKTTGMILQMPLPAGIDARKVQLSISPDKDVEAIHPSRLGRLLYGDFFLSPCTPRAAIEILQHVCPDMAGMEVVVVGHSEIVGKPIANMLLASPDKSPTVTVCHVATKDLAAHTKRADILIVAAGVAQAKWLWWKRQDSPAGPPNLDPLISADMVREGAIVIDVAINRIPKGFDEAGQPLKNDKGRLAMQTVGDVDFEGAKEKASAITPVPGGVGPITVAMLLKNTISCAKLNA